METNPDDLSGLAEAHRKQPESPLTQMVRDGIRPETFEERMKLAGDKLVGNVPLGVDARSKGLRKWIGGGAEFLVVVKFSFFGVVLALIGALCLYVGVADTSDWKVAGLGAVLLALGFWSLRAAGEAWRNFREIAKA